jgi:transcription elongation factor GreB
VEQDDGEERRYRLVGPDEFDVEAGLISVDAPLGRALLGKRVGDVAVIQRPAGRAEVTVVEISWEDGG